MRTRWTCVLTLLAVVCGLPVAAGAQVTAYAIVPTWTSARVTILDAFTGATISSLVMTGEPYDAAVTPDGRYAWITRRALSASSVSVIDLGTKTVVVTIPLGAEPRGVAISPDGKFAYVAQARAHVVSKIDTASYAVFPGLLSSRQPWGLAMAPNGDKTYIVNRATSTLGVLDNGSYTISGAIPVDQEPVEVAIAPDGKTAYVSSTIDNTVVPIQLPTLAVLPSIQVGLFPRDLAVTPDGSKVFVANSDGNSVSVIDTVTRTVIATTDFGINNWPSGVAITPDGTRVLVGIQAGYVRWLDGQTFQHVLLKNVGGQALRLTMTPNLIVPAAAPLLIGDDDDFAARGFQAYVVFNGGTLHATSNWSTRRRVSLLAPGGTIDTHGFDVDLAGGTVNNGTLVKQGDGVLTLSGDNTHASSFVGDGTLSLLGAHAGRITIGSAGTLAGTGTVGPVDARLGGAISPGARGGDAIGTLRADFIGLGSAHTLVIDVDAGTGACDAVVTAQGIALNDATLLTRITGDRPNPGQQCVLATNVTGTFAGLPEGARIAAPAGAYRISYRGGASGRDVVLTAF